jgi:hypothetical protein
MSRGGHWLAGPAAAADARDTDDPVFPGGSGPGRSIRRMPNPDRGRRLREPFDRIAR